MASTGIEVEILKGGMSLEDVTKPEWVQNLWKPRYSDNWQVRPGFGQVAALETTLAAEDKATDGATSTDLLLRKHLGSKIITTSFGHDQIVSVFVNHVTGSEYYTSSITSTRFVRVYSIFIYDLTTDQMWEEAIHRHSSENAGGPTQMQYWDQHYETNEDVDTQEWVPAREEKFFFEYFGGYLYLGNERTGLLAYTPTDFRGRRPKQVANIQRNTWYKGYAESNLIQQVVPVDGLFKDAYTYLNQSTLLRPKAIANLMGRLVLGAQRSVVISDFNKANQFISRNSFDIPSELEITALVPISDNLIIFTESETFLYQPSTAPIIANGNLQVVSRQVGCLNPQAVLARGNSVVWVDRNGVFATTNGLNLRNISEPIDNFFTGSITSPLTSYFVDTGTTSVSRDQPRTLYKFDPSDDVSLAFHEETNSIIVGSPSMDCCWYFNGEWSLWTTESMVSVTGAGAAQVGVTRNILNPYVVANSSGIYLVSSIENQNFTTGDADTPAISRSFQVLQLGKGGALDRSIKDEDNRKIRWRYNKIAHPGGSGGKDRAYVKLLDIDPSGVHRFLVEATCATGQTPTNHEPTTVEFVVTFDNTKWEPVLTSGTFMDLEVCNERLAGKDGYTLGSNANAGTSEAQIYDGAGPSATGNIITIRWDASVSALAHLKLTRDQLNPLFILKFKFKSGATNGTTGLINGVTFCRLRKYINPAVTQTTNLDLYEYQHTYTADLHKNDDVAQPVDWAYKSSQIGLEESNQVRTRGLYANLSSHGKGAPLVANWIYGLYNVLTASDWKGWTTQIIDTTMGIERSDSTETIRKRVHNSSNAIAHKTFNNDVNYQSYLVDDEQFDVIATSVGVKGKSVSHMVFGFLMNRAEKLTFDSIKAVVRKAGGRRRIGR